MAWDDFNDLSEQALDVYIRRLVEAPNGNDKAEEKKLLTIGEYECEEWKLRNQDFQDAMEFRRKYSKRIFILICIWLGFLAFILVLSGLYDTKTPIKSIVWGFHLPDMVVNVLLGSSTVTVVGLFGTVTGHFFNKGKGKDKP